MRLTPDAEAGGCRSTRCDGSARGGAAHPGQMVGGADLDRPGVDPRGADEFYYPYSYYY